jgi:hypothetical protein
MQSNQTVGKHANNIKIINGNTLLHQDQIKKYEMGMVCSTHTNGGNE